MQRPIHRDYYYVDMHAAIDAVKFRVWHLTQKVKDLYRPSDEKKDYFCPRCQAKWTQLEVLDHVDLTRGVFLCHRCDGPLARDEVSAADRAGHERQSRLMAQLDRLLKLLQQIDAEAIPQNDFATALAHAVPVQRDPTVHTNSTPYVPVKAEPNAAAASAPRLAATVAATDLDVLVVNESAAGEAARLARERKTAHQQQNALPVWHTQSTVKAEGPDGGIKAEASAASEAPSSNAPAVVPAANANAVKREAAEDEDVKPPKEAAANGAGMDSLAAYYAEMQEERMRAAARDSSEASEDEDEDEDEDDGFEDVAIGAGAAGGTSGVNTPSSSMSGGPSTVAVKQFGLESGNASTSSPATPTEGAERDGASPAKRVRLDAPVEAANETGRATPAADGDSDSDEFENAL